MKTVLSIITLVSVALCATAQAETMKPGLWEIQNKTAVNGQAMPDMAEMMKDVPPEMRAQMESAMAKNGAAMAGKGVRVCITPEQAASDQVSNPPSNCKVTNQSHSGSTTHISMQCTNPDSEGETEMIVNNDKSWTAKTTMSIKEDGHTQKVVSEASGTWVADDCGAVVPHKK